MFISEATRKDAEERLRDATQHDVRIKEAIARVGAKLDGSDDLLVLCKVDDELRLQLPQEELPLPDALSRLEEHRARMSEQPGPHRPLPGMLWRSPLGSRLEPAGSRYARSDAEAVARGGADSIVSRMLSDCIASADAGDRWAEERAEIAREVQASFERAQALYDFEPCIRSAISNMGHMMSGEEPKEVSGDLGADVYMALQPSKGSSDGQRRHRAWFLEHLRAALRDHALLQVRSAEATAMVEVPALVAERGPLSLYEAAQGWFATFGSKRRLEEAAEWAREEELRVVDHFIDVADDAFCVLDGIRRGDRAYGEVSKQRQAKFERVARALSGGLEILASNISSGDSYCVTEMTKVSLRSFAYSKETIEAARGHLRKAFATPRRAAPASRKPAKRKPVAKRTAAKKKAKKKSR